MPEFEL